MSKRLDRDSSSSPRLCQRFRDIDAELLHHCRQDLILMFQVMEDDLDFLFILDFPLDRKGQAAGQRDPPSHGGARLYNISQAALEAGYAEIFVIDQAAGVPSAGVSLTIQRSPFSCAARNSQVRAAPAALNDIVNQRRLTCRHSFWH